MKKIILFLLSIGLMACSSEKDQLETIRKIALEDIKIQLQLPEGTELNIDDLKISDAISDAEELGEIYEVRFGIKSQDTDGNFIVKNHKLEYVKIGESGLDPSNYELKSFY